MKARSRISSKPARKRIFIVDDHPLMREGIRQWVGRTPGLEVCGEAESAVQAMAGIRRSAPDLVLVDISLPGRSGLELTKDLRARRPDLPVLVLSMHGEGLYAARALRAGARGYVMKRSGGDRVVSAIREVLAGHIAVSQEAATFLLESYTGRHPAGAPRPVPNLTDRECEVLQMVGEAKSNREIAEELRLSPKTVETHRMNLVRKLELKNSAELLRFALRYSANGNATDPSR